MRACLPVILLALLPGAGACTFIVDDILSTAEQDITAEGEGEGGEGEGEGGEGEGEEIDDGDPACEANERLVLVRDEEVDALQVYDLDDGRLARRFPEGTTANVNIDNDDTVAQQNGWGASGVAVGGDDRLYVIGDRFLYQFERSTLEQRTITGRTQLVLESFGSMDHVEVLGGQVLTFGITVRQIAENAAVGAAATVLHDGDDYLGVTSFSIGNSRFVAASAEHGYVVIASDDGAPPQVLNFLDTEFDTDRIHSFGDGFTPKGIGFDAATRKLLLGDLGRVIVMNADDNFEFPTSDAGDYVLPDSGTSDVVAIAARGGFAWIVLRRSRDNLIKLDLSQSPPVGVGIATIAVDSFGRDIAVGCRRVVIAGFDRVVAVDRDDLSSAGNLAVRDVRDLRIVKKADLGLAGDD